MLTDSVDLRDLVSNQISQDFFEVAENKVDETELDKYKKLYANT